jgi:dTDP-4-dehydrorhamnose reductase
MFLLVGGDSEIGAATCRLMKARGHSVAATTRRRLLVADDRPYLDLVQPLNDWRPPDGVQGACVFAAVARMAACANDPAGSTHINVTQTLALIDRLIARGIHVLFLSTNLVFDGATAHVPADAPTCPVCEYGRQKALTEGALRDRMARGEPVAILRLGKVVSPEMPLILDWIENLIAGHPIRAFTDMQMAPVPTEIVTAAIVRLLQDKVRGIFQLTGPRDVSYAETGYRLTERLGVNKALVTATEAATMGLPIGATPHHTTLDSRTLRERYGLGVPDAWEVIEMLMETGRKRGPA